jgi:hypothetical protein
MQPLYPDIKAFFYYYIFYSLWTYANKFKDSYTFFRDECGSKSFFLFIDFEKSSITKYIINRS